MLRFEVEIAWGLAALVAALALVLATLYARALNTALGLEVCRRRTYWTVIGGHVLMAVTMGFISAPMAGLWIVWSVVCGAPLIIRSWLHEWRREDEGVASVLGGLRRVLGEGEYSAGGPGL